MRTRITSVTIVGINTPGSGIEIREAHKYRIENKQTNKIETDKKKKIKMIMMMMIKVGNQTRDNYLNNVTLLVTLLIASGNEDLSRT